ncbi:MAG: BatD family protein [Gammaproteobacteria bacterium]
MRLPNTFPVTVVAMLASLLFSSTLQAAVQARLDRYQAYEGDQLTLFIEADTLDPGEPDLTPLSKDFRILGKNASTQVRIVNGQRSDKVSWRIGLEPLRLGKLQIPPIRVGQEETRPLEVTVTEIPEEIAAQQAQQLFVEAEADTKEKNYVQQQIPFRVRLLHDGSLIGGELGEPQIEHAVVERLGDEVRYSTMRNGRLYQVIERRYVILPERSGELRIPPVPFKGEVSATQGAPGQQPGDSMLGNTPFFRNTPFRGPGRPVRARSKPLTLEILPRPAGAAAKWLPAEQVSLRDSWTQNPPQLRAGEPVTRTITIEARGLTGSQIPVLEPERPAETRVYSEQPAIDSRTDGNKVFGFSRQSFTYLPNRAGKLTIPPIELEWWNTETDSAETARLPQWDLTVAPGAAGAGSAPPRAAAQGPDATASESAPDSAAGSREEPQGTESEPGLKSQWWWLLLLLVIPLLLVLFRRTRSPSSARQRHEKPTSGAQHTPARPRPDLETALARLEQACGAGDAKAAASALLEAGEASWPDDPPRNLGTLAGRLGGDAGEQVSELDRVLYGSEAQQWNGAALWKAVRDAWKAPGETRNGKEELLEPLYPSR